MNDRARPGGFTLLEVMLAMTVLAMVVAIAYAAFYLGQRAVERGEVAVVTAQRLRVASDVLIRQIKSAVAYPARNRDEEVYPYFVGKTFAMAFSTLSAKAPSEAADAPAGFTITGKTYSHDGVARLLARLAVVPHLSAIQPQHSSVTPSKAGRPVVEFSIQALIKSPGVA